jgi:hypothetical protein
MVQETGETRNAIIEDDNKHIKEILSANTNRKEKYWIVVFAKPSRNTIEGKPVLNKHIKAYAVKPSSQVGMIVGEVDNHLGTVRWEVNMPQVPFNYDGLIALGAQEGEDIVTETTTIPFAYVTK